MEQPVLHAEHLTKRYGQHFAVQDVTFSLRPGELVGLLGPNGAGKTTTLSMLAGLVQPTSGEIRLFGQKLDTPAGQAALRRVGIMPEAAVFYPYLSGEDNLAVLARTYNVDPRVIPSLCERVGLSEHSRRPAKSYSQGMRQMLSLASALLGDPDILLLDEPTNGLDPLGQQRIHALLKELVEKGKTILLSSHLLPDVEALCNRVIIIARGRVVADGPLSALLQHTSCILLRTTDDHRARALLTSPERPAWIAGIEERENALVIYADPARAGELSAMLAKQDIYPVELVPQRESLHDVFAELVGDSPTQAKEHVA